MSQTYEFYNTRAKEAAVEATQATLVNVRERALRSEKVWRGMAEQAKKVEEDRAKAKREKEVQREAADEYVRIVRY